MSNELRKRLPLLINDRSNLDAAYDASLTCVLEDDALRSKINNHLRAYYEAGNLLPEELEKVLSGHIFPYVQSQIELESGYLLNLHGLYRYSYFGLRSCLELGVLQLFFAADDREHLRVRPWLRSLERTPNFQPMVRRLRDLPCFAEFERDFGVFDRLLTLHDRLGGYVHVRGGAFSSQGLAGSNTTRFSEATFRDCCSEMFQVVSNLLTLLLLKYPLGMQPLPLSEKCGFNTPLGGFLEGFQVELITAMLSPAERTRLQSLSDADPDVREVVECFNRLPDLTEEQWEAQRKEWDELIGTRDAPL